MEQVLLTASVGCRGHNGLFIICTEFNCLIRYADARSHRRGGTFGCCANDALFILLRDQLAEFSHQVRPCSATVPLEGREAFQQRQDWPSDLRQVGRLV